MKQAIFTFSKPSENSTVASTRIARFLEETIQQPLFYDDSIADARADTLFIVNGAFAFCKCLPAIGLAVRKATRIVWVQNDYTINPPGAVSSANSPFRKAFRTRKGEPVHYWTTVRKNADMTLLSSYINWNSLTYEPHCAESVKHAQNDLFYYGAFRAGRVEAFDEYAALCADARITFTISSTSNKFAERYSTAQCIPGISRDGFYAALGTHRLGLYIEDKKSHREFHSPANRFYEMLSAGVPMVFQPESVKMLSEAGYAVDPYVADSATALRRLFRNSKDIAAEQHALWATDYRKQLQHKVRGEYRAICAA